GACPARAGFPLRFNTGQEIFMAAIFAFHAGKAVVQIAAIEIAIDYLLDIGPPEAVLPGEMLVIDPDKGLK
ncbi:MAG: hypothetical protein Q7U03_01600, partial [Syntrophales bacterium]|nr:hypothetical protein [Syntrophales bacterium]